MISRKTQIGGLLVLVFTCNAYPQSDSAETADAEQSEAAPAVDYRSGILFSSDDPSQLLVRDVTPGSAAERAKIQPGDTIVMVDDRPFAAAEDVEAYLTTLQGDRARIIVLRDGREQALIYVNEASDVETVRVPVPTYGQPAGIGVRLAGAEQPLVVAVWNESPAEQAGIVPGDRLVAVNGIQLRGTRAFVAAVASHATDDEIQMTVLRDGDVHELKVHPQTWTKVFDDEPVYLEGWRERQRRTGCGRFDDVYADDVYADVADHATHEALTRQIDELRAEVEFLREELSRVNDRLDDATNAGN